MHDLRLVSRNIAELYVKTAPYISEAAEMQYIKGEEARKRENRARWTAIHYFKTLVLNTCNLPKVMSLEEEDKTLFKDAQELLDKLDKAFMTRMPSRTLQQIWVKYTNQLVKADLINAYKLSEQRNIWQ